MTDAKLSALKIAKDKVLGIDVGLDADDIIKVVTHAELEALDTPGHTMSHVCLRSHTNIPALFCGDTLFNAGAGNCHSGGHPVELYHTFANQLAKRPDETLVYPGYDYIAGNLKFILDHEPDNAETKLLLNEVEDQDPSAVLVPNKGLEKEVNSFFRLHSPSIINTLRNAFLDLPENPDPQIVFIKLRELWNDW